MRTWVPLHHHSREMSVQSIVEDDEPWRIPREEHNHECDCEKPALERTSWTEDNPARRFWNCKNSLRKNVPKCQWFLWKDEEMDEGYYKKKLYEMRMDIEKKDKILKKRVGSSNVVALQNQVKELESILGVKNTEMWKLKLKVYVLLFVVTVGIVMKIVN